MRRHVWHPSRKGVLGARGGGCDGGRRAMAFDEAASVALFAASEENYLASSRRRLPVPVLLVSGALGAGTGARGPPRGSRAPGPRGSLGRSHVNASAAPGARDSTPTSADMLRSLCCGLGLGAAV